MNKELNLAIWDAVQKTDTKYTKQVTVNRRTFTSITPAYQQKIATEMFGPRGLGWGIVPGSEVYDQVQIDKTTLLTYTATFFYVWDGQRGELPVRATESLAYVTNGGKGYLKVDDEADKKVRTSAVSKVLAELGFNSDVFMGEFEDHEYRNIREQESRMAHAEDKLKAKREGIEELNDWLKTEIAALRKVPNKNAVVSLVNVTEQKIKDRCSILNEDFTNYVKELHKAGHEIIGG